MERNIRLYPAYLALFWFMAWLPIFFLFFGRYVTIEQVLRLSAIYYFSVVVVEVPSGYFSDRVGRRPTLIISALSVSAAYICFFLGSSFAIFALGQVLLAIGYGFQSGTDTSLHYDSLVALGRESEYGQREAIAYRNSFISSAIATMVGGVLGMMSLRYAYAASLVCTLGALVIVWSFEEPPEAEPAPGVLTQLRKCLAYGRQKPLQWLFLFTVLMTIIEHIPFEFYQPYISLLEADLPLFTGRIALLSGIVMTVSKLVGALAANYSIRLAQRIGTAATLLASVVIETFIIGLMSLLLHPLIILVVFLRDTPSSLAHAPRNEAIAPRVGQAQRATYLSLQSLAGRLAYSMTLVGLSFLAGADAPTDWSTLSAMLRSAALISAVGLVVLLLLLGWMRDASTQAGNV